MNDTPLDGGFRRTSAPPPPTSVARLRRLLLAAARGQPDAVRDGLARIGAWENLPLLMNGPWFGQPFRDGVTSRRSLQRRLRLLGTPVVSPAVAATLPRGRPVTLRGKARKTTRNSLISYIWANAESSNGNVRLLLEEGHDFFLELDPSHGLVLVAAAGGHLIQGDRVDDGDDVEVFGFVDRVVDPRAPDGSVSARHPPLCPAVRSGDELTLIIRKLP